MKYNEEFPKFVELELLVAKQSFIYPTTRCSSSPR